MKSKHKYTIRIEIETDAGKSTYLLETRDEHDTEHSRPINECIAITMAGLLQSIVISGRVVCPSTFEETAQAFSDEMLEARSAQSEWINLSHIPNT